jgi:2-oxo-3-hexenedioate decarboxylase
MTSGGSDRERVTALADELEAAYRTGRMSPSAPSAREGGLMLAAAYEVEAELARRRRARGRRTVGVKVGFANKAMWRILKLETLVWGHLYDDTVHVAPGGDARHEIRGRVAPRIEPEVVVRLARPLEPGLTDPAAVLDAVEWLALGFEINDCVFPDWKFQPADFVAAYGFHTALIVGSGRAPRAGDAEALATFTLALAKNGTVAEQGAGKNALRSPARCVAELVTALASQTLTAPLAAGDLVSTGTLTTPQPIAAGETWTATADGIDLAPLTLRIV